MDFGARYKKENIQNKNFPADEESDTQKEKDKEKSEEQEKYYSRNHHIITSQFQLSDKDKFICYSTKLNAHPYQDDDIQPPKAV